MAYEVPKHFLDHLAGQFELAHPVLFTGAGFSLAAGNVNGTALPTVDQLKRILWSICFPGEPYDTTATLADLYGTTANRHAKQLTATLTPLLTVNAESLPDWYRTIFSYPWAKSYTLNIDDLALAVARRFELPRTPIVRSALDPTASPGDDTDSLRNLPVIHLNGIKSDLPDGVTFSPDQYAERLARQDVWYLALVSELLTRPFVFIGTTLDEPPLWQHIALRQQRGGRALRELRPRSYLVTPSLTRPKQALLADYHVEWLPLTAEQFAHDVLEQIRPAAVKGNELISQRFATRRGVTPTLAEVAALAVNPLEKTEYLLGQEPRWADIQAGRAIRRERDAALEILANTEFSKPKTKDVVLLTGTAGSGKSTALMRLCLALSTKGNRVAWVDRSSDLSPRSIRDAMLADGGPPVLAIDDADLFGTELSPMLRELALSGRAPLLLIAIRSGRVERVVNPNILRGVHVLEQTIPHLTDNDIGSLLDVLDRENRLGYLKGKSRDDQFRLFQQHCGRQLLVAMIQATSNTRFEDKAAEEFRELSPEAKVIYALVAIASSFRFGLSRDEIVIGAGGDASNAVLNQIDELSRRHVIVLLPSGELAARHRVIADIIVEELRKSGTLERVLTGVALVAAAKVTPQLRRSARPWRLLRAVINHDFLARTIGLENARNLYGSLEGVLSWDYQFWLQRGSIEVEQGQDLSLAENFLNQAVGLGGDDPYVQTEFAYLLFRKAAEDPRSVDAPSLVSEATSILQDMIYRRGEADAYPYHVLGSQGLMWARRGITDPKQKEIYLRGLIAQTDDGISKHSSSKELQQLHSALEHELLSIAVTRR